VKSPEKPAKNHAAKQKQQIIALGGLSAVFAAVLAIQFGGGEAPPPAAAMTAPAPGPSGEVAESSGASADEAPPAVPVPVAKDNPVLAEPVADASIKRSPFSNFWSVTPTTTRTTAPSLSAPTITLNATMPSESRGLAVIDGALLFVGDTVQGWSLASVGPRSVTLQAPAGETVVIDMPLLVGQRELPPGLDLADAADAAEAAAAAAAADGTAFDTTAVVPSGG
jgi:hypothetical protein